MNGSRKRTGDSTLLSSIPRHKAGGSRLPLILWRKCGSGHWQGPSPTERRSSLPGAGMRQRNSMLRLCSGSIRFLSIIRLFRPISGLKQKRRCRGTVLRASSAPARSNSGSISGASILWCSTEHRIRSHHSFSGLDDPAGGICRRRWSSSWHLVKMPCWLPQQ